MPDQQTEIAVFGGGCFWCTEAVFARLKGVTKVTSGYAGGAAANPTYFKVSEGLTGHAEVIHIEFDPSVITYEQLLEVFWATHDPTTLNQQGADIGPQYRSVIFYTSKNQHRIATESIVNLQQSGEYHSPIVTQVEQLEQFYPAEEYHQQYYQQHSDQPYCQIVISPKLQKLQEKFSSLLK